MKTRLNDPILQAWEAIRIRNRDRAAIFDLRGKIARTFSEIEEGAEHFASELKPIEPGKVVAIHIGNHPDWPSLFLACLRKQLVVLPLEQTLARNREKARFQFAM